MDQKDPENNGKGAALALVLLIGFMYLSIYWWISELIDAWSKH